MTKTPVADRAGAQKSRAGDPESSQGADTASRLRTSVTRGRIDKFEGQSYDPESKPAATVWLDGV
jgi:hypothetical protein